MISKFTAIDTKENILPNKLSRLAKRGSSLSQDSAFSHNLSLKGPTLKAKRFNLI